MKPQIELKIAGPLAEVIVDNRARRNAVNAAMWRQLHDVAQELSRNEQVRAVLVRGNGAAAFSAGADISDFDESRSDNQQSRSYDDLVESACRAVEGIPQPTIAAIRGACVGAGMSIAASCDLIVAGDDAYFAVPAARLGLGYDPRGIERFLRVFGVRTARRLLLCAEKMSAESAEKLGVVDVVVTAEKLSDVAGGMLQRIAMNAPLTVRAAKFAIFSQTVTRDDTRHAEAMRLAHLADNSTDYREGRAAFRDRRLPRFSGI
ncbi:enoyl-CoA hydratase-related protein [Paraburkholderia sp. 22B1P]|jgi:enoyl-CoA hydratase/carnithine racemase|uniref:enoyl-CoA hydratase/isomerase family protein n=1 Tax=Paraburkholderia sp. 22B1P TaxID=3080498 RepID=UPI00308BB4CE|nr:enoyl-CoA hydratase-related protein [Paraburkholderia sp. 22B1P]